MATIIDPPNSVWPNGLKVDSEGYVTFYPLGTNKVDINTITWPDGDTLISPFVYQNDKLVGFVDTKALTVSGPATTTMNYNHIEADFASISEGKLTVNAPNAVVKKFKWSVVESDGDDNVIVTVKYKGCKTVDDVKAVDSEYKTTDIVNGAWTEGLGDLEDGSSMFADCSALTSFSSDLSSLTDGSYMFKECKLDTASVQNIADTINTYSGTIHIGIGNSSPNEQEKTAFNTIASKGWTVFVNGREYTPTTPAAITTLDENGEEITTPIPYWAKPVQTDEEHAKYIDSEGNFFNILGGQFIYGNDISTYGMFTCEEDAAANMRLTPYVKPQTEIENQ